MTEILKVLVGSQAHGLADETSDFDYRAVFIEPTSEHLRIGGKIKNTNWVEGDNDNTAWEIGHFLQLATRCNPTILEVFHAPIVSGIVSWNPERPSSTDRLRSLFSDVWNVKDLVNSHVGYGLNQRKKFLEDKDGRKSKYASAYLRTLFQAYSLLTDGVYPVNMKDTPIYETLLRYRRGEYEYGEVIDTCLGWQRKLEKVAGCTAKETNLSSVNDFLLQIRKENW